MDRPIQRRGNGYAVSRDLTPRLVPVADCKPLGRETRTHSSHQVRKLAGRFNQFGFVLPILIDAEQRVVAGWGLVQAARQMGLTEVPAVSLTDMSEAELRMLRLPRWPVLDPFGGAGTTLIAAEQTGRRAGVIELDPIFVDVSIERWQRLAGGTAIHADNGQRFMRPAASQPSAPTKGEEDGKA